MVESGTTIVPITKIYSLNNRFAFSFQGDGNACLYNILTGAVPFCTITSGRRGVTMTMQTDCNLVMYTAGGGTVWSSGTTVSVWARSTDLSLAPAVASHTDPPPSLPSLPPQNKATGCSLRVTDDGKVQISGTVGGATAIVWSVPT